MIIIVLLIKDETVTLALNVGARARTAGMSGSVVVGVGVARPPGRSLPKEGIGSAKLYRPYRNVSFLFEMTINGN